MDAHDGRSIWGAIFVANHWGDPLEFCFTRVEVGTGTFWRRDLAYRKAVALLVKALFEAASHAPDLVLVLAEEIPHDILADELEVQVPVCLAGNPAADGAPLDGSASGTASAVLQWINGEPAEDTPLSALVELLKARNLLLEPFHRAARGLEEAFAD
jgi:hypothetical protein